MTLSRSFRPFSLLLTGTPGHLCNAVLARLGDALPALTRVRCLIQPNSSDDEIRIWRAAHPSVTELAFGDLLDAESLESLCADMRGGVVLHAAAVYHPRTPDEWMRVNRDGTLALAHAAKNAGVKRFVFISSTEAQGAASINALLTEEMPCYPCTLFGRSKFEAEEALLNMQEPGVFDVVIIRPSLFYGIPVSGYFLQLIAAVRKGRARMVGRGQTARSLSHMDDLAGGIILAMLHPDAPGEVFNMCDAHSYTELEILKAIAAGAGVKARFRSVSKLACVAASLTDKALIACNRYNRNLHTIGAAPRHTGASCRKAQQILGFSSRGDTRESFRQMVEWAVDQNP